MDFDNLNFKRHRQVDFAVCYSHVHNYLACFCLQVLTHGQPGEEVSLELILRVVADVGLVVRCFSNAGISSFQEQDIVFII
jgi:hypothetical protein